MGVYGFFDVARKVFSHHESGVVWQESEALFYRPPRWIRAAEHGDRPRILLDHHFGPGANARQQPGEIAGSFRFRNVERGHIQNDTSLFDGTFGQTQYSPVSPAGRVFQRRWIHSHWSG